MNAIDRLQVAGEELSFHLCRRSHEECLQHVTTYYRDVPAAQIPKLVQAVKDFNDQFHPERGRIVNQERDKKLIVSLLPQDYAPHFETIVEKLYFAQSQRHDERMTRQSAKTALANYFSEGQDRLYNFVDFLTNGKSDLDHFIAVDTAVKPHRVNVYEVSSGDFRLQVEVYTNKRTDVLGVGFREV